MKKELKIGIFVLAIGTVSLFLINYLRGKDLFNREMELVGIYENAEGLLASAPVNIKGYKAGKVSEVAYNPATGNFKVVCSVSRDFVIPEDSRMVIYAVDIMGGKGIRIDLGTSETASSDADTLRTGVEAGLLDGLADGVGPLLAKLGTTIDSLEVTVSGVNRLLTEENVANISSALASLRSSVGNLDRVMASVEGKTDDIDNFIGNLSDFSDRLDAIAEKADTLVGGVNEVVDAVNRSELEELIASFRSLAEGINDPDGTVGKLLNNSSVYDSVDSLLLQINSLVKNISENPKKYLKISVF